MLVCIYYLNSHIFSNSENVFLHNTFEKRVIHLRCDGVKVLTVKVSLSKITFSLRRKCKSCIAKA